MEKPICYRDADSFDAGRRLCVSCPWLFVCGSLLGHEFNVERADFIRSTLREGVPPYEPDFLLALQEQYGITHNAARLAVRYQIKVRGTW